MVGGLPIFLTAMAQAHPVFISKDNHKIRLVLHHPGNQDEHEKSRVVQKHHPDFLDRVIAVSKKGELPHSDHEIEISPAEDKRLGTTKQLISKNQNLYVTGNVTPISAKPIVSHFLGHASFETNSSSLSLGGTILRI